MTARRRLTASQRRAAILEAAMEAFATRGYHGTSLDEVAAAAGVSKALIYEHFASKRELREVLVAEQAAEIFSRLAANAASGSFGEERLRGGVDAFLGFVEERRDAWRVLFRDAADPELGEVVARVRQQAAGLIVALAREDPAAPASERIIAMHAEMLSGAVQALANWWLEHPEVPREHLVDQVVDFAWTGLERLRASEQDVRGAPQNHGT